VKEKLLIGKVKDTETDQRAYPHS